MSGTFEPGEWIREAALRDEFGVSNGPVREALQILIAERLLVHVPYRGVRVVQLDRADIIELFQLRGALLELAAELAARRRDPAAIAKIPEIRNYVAAAIAGTSPFTGELTTWIAQASGNNRLAQAWNELYLQTQLYIPATRAAQRSFQESSACITALIAAIDAGDAETARMQSRALTQSQIEALGFDGT